MSVIAKNLPPREYQQFVWCPREKWGMVITVQARRGGHTCAKCNGDMEVYEPRPKRLGGLYGPPSGGER